MSEERELTRRELLIKAASAGAVTVGAGLFITSCKKDGGGAKGGGGEGGGAKEGGGGGGGDSCDDVSGLTDAEKKTREQLKYVNKSPKKDQTCDNCNLFTAPEGGKTCGGCTVVKGPIHPKGWCTAWAPKTG